MNIFSIIRRNFFIYFTPRISVQRRGAQSGEREREPWLGLQDSEIGTNAERKRQRKKEEEEGARRREELVWKKGGVVG